MRFENKVCVVTGGGSGIGRATCLRFSREGGQSVIIDNNVENGNETVNLIQSAGGLAFFIETNIAIPDQIKICVDKIIEKFGRIDVLINNAAIMTFNPILELQIEDWNKVM